MRMALDDEAISRRPLLARDYLHLVGEDPRLLPAFAEMHEDGALEPAG
jgi:hypothetical protein